MVSDAMEQLCAPTRRYQDIWELGRNGDEDPFAYTEVALTVPVEDFLIYYWDWNDLRAFLNGGMTPKLLWITENAFLVVDDEENEFDFEDDIPIIQCISAIFHETSGQFHRLTLAQLHHSDISTGGVSVFWRTLATSNSVELTIVHHRVNFVVLPSGPILSKFLRESPALQVLELYRFQFEEEHCRALATLERTDMKLTINHCTLEPHNAEGTFIEWFRHNQVVTELDCCKMGSNILSALGGNNSVKKLTIDRRMGEYDEEEMRCLIEALTGNMSIEHLTIFDFRINDETWTLLFRSLSTHPRIKLLTLRHKWMDNPTSLSAASRSSMMHTIIRMLRRNTVVHTIELPDYFNNEEVYQNSILPRLEMNRSCFEVQRRAVKRADPSIRSQLLGRALHVVRSNPELVFLFLSENVPAFVRTEEEVVGDSAAPLEQDPVVVSGQKRKAPS
jgi:hypothetical protein